MCFLYMACLLVCVTLSSPLFLCSSDILISYHLFVWPGPRHFLFVRLWICYSFYLVQLHGKYHCLMFWFEGKVLHMNLFSYRWSQSDEGSGQGMGSLSVVSRLSCIMKLVLFWFLPASISPSSHNEFVGWDGPGGWERKPWVLFRYVSKRDTRKRHLKHIHIRLL